MVTWGLDPELKLWFEVIRGQIRGQTKVKPGSHEVKRFLVDNAIFTNLEFKKSITKNSLDCILALQFACFDICWLAAVASKLHIKLQANTGFNFRGVNDIVSLHFCSPAAISLLATVPISWKWTTLHHRRAFFDIAYLYPQQIHIHDHDVHWCLLALQSVCLFSVFIWLVRVHQHLQHVYNVTW